MEEKKKEGGNEEKECRHTKICGKKYHHWQNTHCPKLLVFSFSLALWMSAICAVILSSKLVFFNVKGMEDH